MVIKAASDDHWQIAVEAAATIHDFPELFSSQLASVYKPLIERIMVHALSRGFEYSVKLQISKLQGRILDCLITHDLFDQRLERQLFEFFRLCIEKPADHDEKFFEDGREATDLELAVENASESPLINALLNLPCFYLHMKGGTSGADVSLRKTSMDEDFSSIAGKRSASIKMLRTNSRGNFLQTPKTMKAAEEKAYRHGF